MSVNEKMTAIADTIRAQTLSTEKLRLDDMPGEIAMACLVAEEAGRQSGYADGVDDGRAEGMQAEYDRFWDVYQQNGNRTDYQNAFSGIGWTDETFQPKYDIVDANSAFYMTFRKSGMVDLGEAIRKSGIRFTVHSDRMQYTFNSSPYLEVVDGMEFTKQFIQISAAFDNCTKLRKIQTLPISENAAMLEFANLPALEEISFSGVISANISFQKSTKLNRASIESVVNTLSATTSGLTLTLSKTAVDIAFGGYENGVLEMEGSGTPEWTELVESKPNWTISLV